MIRQQLLPYVLSVCVLGVVRDSLTQEEAVDSAQVNALKVKPHGLVGRVPSEHEILVDMEIPQTRPFSNAHTEYIIDYLFPRPLNNNLGQADPSNTHTRPSQLKFCQCGVASNRIHRYGENLIFSQLEFPWRVYVVIVSSTGDEKMCAGTLISMSWVLTAASCIGHEAVSVTVRGLNENGDQWQMKSLSWINHPFFNEVTRDSDIGLVKLPSTLTASMTIHPICLPWKVRYRDFSRTTVATLAWPSSSANSSVVSALEKLTVPFLSSHECQVVMRRKSKRYPRITNNMVCIEKEDMNSCEMQDYGGSIDYFDHEGRITYILGISTDSNHICDDANFYPHFGTRIVNFLDWIFNSAMGAEFCVT